MANFFAMGGYAIFVWPAYTASALVLGIAIVLSLKAHARARKMVRRLEEESSASGDSES
jgi:heme exporter protein CcmD